MSGTEGRRLVGHGPGLTSNHGTINLGKQDNQAVETVPISIVRHMIGRLIIAHCVCIMFVSLFSDHWKTDCFLICFKIIYILHVANCHFMHMSSLANKNQNGCRRHLFQSGLLSVTLFQDLYYNIFNVSLIFVLSNVCLIFWFNVLGGRRLKVHASCFLFIQQMIFFRGWRFL